LIPSDSPGEIGQVVLELRVGEGRSELHITGLAGDLPEAVNSNLREAKNPKQKAGTIPQYRGNTPHRGCCHQERE
jgi:hypothetical protein